MIAVPVAVGVLLGVGPQRGWIRHLLAYFRLYSLSPHRTDWEWAFGQISGPTFLLVTLNDGSQVAGLFGYDSLAASDHPKRDLLMEEVYDIDETGGWQPRPQKQGSLSWRRTSAISSSLRPRDRHDG